MLTRPNSLLPRPALSEGAGAKTKDKWGIFKSIDDARSDSVAGASAGWGALDGREGGCASVPELKDEIALLKGKLASAERSRAVLLYPSFQHGLFVCVCTHVCMDVCRNKICAEMESITQTC